MIIFSFIMKKHIFIILALFFVTNNAFSQIRDNAYFDGYWGKWSYSGVEIHGNYDGFITYYESEGPWEYRFKFTIDNFKVPNKKQMKKDIKANKWYEYSGTVEYYMTDDLGTIYNVFKKNKLPVFVCAKLGDGRKTRKIKSKAKICIAAFKNQPEVYNFWFDNVGYAINLNGVKFPNVKFE